MTSTNVKVKEMKQLCTLPNGREIFPGDKVWRTDLHCEKTAQGIYTDFEGDEYLTFEEGGNALVNPISDFYKTNDASIKLR